MSRSSVPADRRRRKKSSRAAPRSRLPQTPSSQRRHCRGRAARVPCAQVTYAAILHSAQGAFSDSGNGFFSLEADAPGTTVPTIFFDETFDTSNGVLPADKDGCKNGGYRDFPQFKNQGDCVSFVTTQGKNPPSGG